MMLLPTLTTIFKNKVERLALSNIYIDHHILSVYVYHNSCVIIVRCAACIEMRNVFVKTLFAIAGKEESDALQTF